MFFCEKSRMAGRVQLLSALTTVILTLLLHMPYTAQAGESRAILDEGFSWMTPREADNTLQRIKQAGFNVFIPCVWHGRGVSWASSLAPKEPLWAKQYRPGYDPLAYLITRAHQMGIEVHPWFTVTDRQRDFLREYYDYGSPKDSFNVHLPAFRNYIVDLMLEVVRNYDVDGINLDYIRAKGVCRSMFCVDDYRLKQKRDLLADIEEMEKQRWSAAADSLAQWNAGAVTDIVASFSRQAREIKPGLLISVDSVVGMRPFVIDGADSVVWANSGLIDVIFQMDYQDQQSEINKVFLSRGFAGLTDPDKLVLLAGNYVRQLTKDGALPRDARSVSGVVSFAQHLRPKGNGVALYQYRFLTDGQIDALASGPFKTPTRPDWKKNRTLN